jgi:hypothetical protein
MHSRRDERCEFLEFAGAHFRHRPPNAGPEDLLAMWKLQARTSLPRRTSGQVRADLGNGKSGLKWSGGRAGSHS